MVGGGKCRTTMHQGVGKSLGIGTVLLNGETVARHDVIK
jgi:hypothetical protein